MLAGHELLASILDGVPQPVWVVDHPGNIVFANPAAVAALGYEDAAELRGRQSHETVHYKHPDGSSYLIGDCPMLRPRITGETVHSEDEWFVRRDGSLFPIAWWSAPLQMPDGGIPWLLLGGRGLTNIVKHAHATRADVTIGTSESEFVITVSDDGVGGAQPKAQGSGLLGPADRLAALNGRLPPWRSRAATQLRGAGETLSPPRNNGRTIMLTPQQLRIATMAAGGLTNKQIAARCRTSHRGVGSVLYRVFRVLDISSRAALGDALANYDIRTA